MSGAPILFLVIGKPFENYHQQLILERISQELKTWSEPLSGCDLGSELSSLLQHQSASLHGQNQLTLKNDKLLLVILFNPTLSLFKHHAKKYLAVKSCFRQLVYSGPAVAECGSWLLNDGPLTFVQLSKVLKELEMPDFEPFYINAYSLAKWSQENIEKFTGFSIKLNPDISTIASGDVANLDALLSVVSKLIKNDEEKDAAMKGLEAFQMTEELVGGKKNAFKLWKVKHMDHNVELLQIADFKILINTDCAHVPFQFLNNLDVLMLNSCTLKTFNWLNKALEAGNKPNIGLLYNNALGILQQKKINFPKETNSSEDNLLVSGYNTLQKLFANLRSSNIPIQFGTASTNYKPILLYHNIAIGSLNLYPVTPSSDSKEYREFDKSFSNESLFSKGNINITSSSFLLTWDSFNKEKKTVRLLFTGLTSQVAVFEGLNRLKKLGLFTDSVKKKVLKEVSQSSSGKAGMKGDGNRVPPRVKTTSSSILSLPIASKPPPKKIQEGKKDFSVKKTEVKEKTKANSILETPLKSPIASKTKSSLKTQTKPAPKISQQLFTVATNASISTCTNTAAKNVTSDIVNKSGKPSPKTTKPPPSKTIKDTRLTKVASEPGKVDKGENKKIDTARSEKVAKKDVEKSQAAKTTLEQKQKGKNFEKKDAEKVVKKTKEITSPTKSIKEPEKPTKTIKKVSESKCLGSEINKKTAEDKTKRTKTSIQKNVTKAGTEEKKEIEIVKDQNNVDVKEEKEIIAAVTNDVEKQINDVDAVVVPVVPVSSVDVPLSNDKKDPEMIGEGVNEQRKDEDFMQQFNDKKEEKAEKVETENTENMEHLQEKCNDKEIDECDDVNKLKDNLEINDVEMTEEKKMEEDLKDYEVKTNGKVENIKSEKVIKGDDELNEESNVKDDTRNEVVEGIEMKPQEDINLLMQQPSPNEEAPLETKQTVTAMEISADSTDLEDNKFEEENVTSKQEVMMNSVMSMTESAESAPHDNLYNDTHVDDYENSSCQDSIEGQLVEEAFDKLPNAVLEKTAECTVADVQLPGEDIITSIPTKDVPDVGATLSTTVKAGRNENVSLENDLFNSEAVESDLKVGTTEETQTFEKAKSNEVVEKQVLEPLEKELSSQKVDVINDISDSSMVVEKESVLEICDKDLEDVDNVKEVGHEDAGHEDVGHEEVGEEDVDEVKEEAVGVVELDLGNLTENNKNLEICSLENKSDNPEDSQIEVAVDVVLKENQTSPVDLQQTETCGVEDLEINLNKDSNERANKEEDILLNHNPQPDDVGCNGELLEVPTIETASSMTDENTSKSVLEDDKAPIVDDIKEFIAATTDMSCTFNSKDTMNDEWLSGVGDHVKEDFAQLCGEVADNFDKLKDTLQNKTNNDFYDNNLVFNNEDFSMEDQDELETIAEHPEIEEEEARLMEKNHSLSDTPQSKTINSFMGIEAAVKEVCYANHANNTLENNHTEPPNKEFLSLSNGGDELKDDHSKVPNFLSDLSPVDANTNASVQPASTDDIVAAWGEPMKLPSPERPGKLTVNKENSTQNQTLPLTMNASRKNTKKQVSVKGLNETHVGLINGDKAHSKTKTSSNSDKKSECSNSTRTSSLIQPFYTDVTFISERGSDFDSIYSVDFFKKVRSQCYVIGARSATKTIDQLLTAKQNWEAQKEPEVTDVIVGSHATSEEKGLLEEWMAGKEQLLQKLKVKVQKLDDNESLTTVSPDFQICTM